MQLSICVFSSIVWNLIRKLKIFTRVILDQAIYELPETKFMEGRPLYQWYSIYLVSRQPKIQVTAPSVKDVPVFDCIKDLFFFSEIISDTMIGKKIILQAVYYVTWLQQ